MIDKKPLLASKTVWGALIALSASLLGLVGLPIADNDQAAILEIVTQAATLIGSALALYGRITASRVIAR